MDHSVDSNLQMPRKRIIDGKTFYEISVPNENGFFWSLFLCFFMNRNKNDVFSTLSDFSVDKQNKIIKRFDSIQESIEHYFFENRSFYYTEELIHEMMWFYQLYGASNIDESGELFKRTSNFLDCCVTSVDENIDYRAEIFPDYPDKCFYHLVIFQKREVNSEEIIVSFGVDETVVTEKQRIVIKEVFDLANEYDVNCQLNVNDIPEIALDLDLAVSLLEHKCFEFLFKLYEQPPYVFEKLSQAGVLTTISKTAFFHAVLSKRFDLLYLLYKHAIYAPQWWKTASRDSTSELQEKSTNVCRMLTELQSEIGTHSNLQDNLSLIDELIQINEFQKTLILACNENGSVATVDSVKRKITKLLGIYIDHFCTNEVNLQLFSNYFEFSDILAAMYFFDRSFLLKRNLKLPNDAYETIESAFCSLLFYDRVSQDEIRDCFDILKYLNRKQFLSHLNDFKKILVETERSSNVKRLPSTELDVLKSEPIIKEAFSLERLIRYLELIDKLDSSDKLVFPLAIERCLQVIGEYLNPNSEQSPTVISAMTISVFSPNLNTCLVQIRHLLSHFDKKTVHQRHKNFHPETYEHIQYELKNFLNYFKSIVFVETYRLAECFLERFKKISNISALETEENDVLLTKLSKSLESIKNDLDNSSVSDNLVSIHFRNMKESIEDNIKCINNEKDVESITKLFVRLKHYKELMCFWLKNFKRTNIPACEELLEKLETVTCNYKTSSKINPNVLWSFSLLYQFINMGLHVFGHFPLLFFLNDGSANNGKEQAIIIYNRLTDFESKAIKIMNPNFNIVQNEENSKPEPDISYIKEFNRMLHGHGYLTEDEKNIIISDVPEVLRNDYNIGMTLLERLRSDETDNCEVEFAKISEARRDSLEAPFYRSDLKSFENMLKDITKPYLKLQDCLKNNEILTSEKKYLCEKISFTERSKKLLSDIEIKDKSKEEDISLEFLKNRVKKMRDILVNRVYNSDEAKYESDSLETRHDKILQSFMSDEPMQAAFEHLYIDVVELLKWKNLCNKTDGLLNGINLRHVLCHGNPLLEALTYLLDIYDVPNEIIKKILRLVSDYGAIAAMSELHTKNPKLKYKHYVKLIESNTQRQWNNLILKIKSCPHWSDYAILVPGWQEGPRAENWRQFFVKCLITAFLVFALIIFLYIVSQNLYPIVTENLSSEMN